MVGVGVMEVRGQEVVVVIDKARGHIKPRRRSRHNSSSRPAIPVRGDAFQLMSAEIVSHRAVFQFEWR